MKIALFISILWFCMLVLRICKYKDTWSLVANAGWTSSHSQTIPLSVEIHLDQHYSTIYTYQCTILFHTNDVSIFVLTLEHMNVPVKYKKCSYIKYDYYLLNTLSLSFSSFISRIKLSFTYNLLCSNHMYARFSF